MNAQVKAIRDEIERRKAELSKDKTIHPSNQAGRIKELEYIERFIDSLPDEPSGWISVKERLPKEKER